ncbi:MAG: ATP-binding protein, partial [Segatella copri]|nr:ATP-binding protein [Segatella copri]
IQMRIYDRSIELWNFGLLPEQLTPSTLMLQHSSYPRNHNIANVFYKAGFVESWGRGFKKISDEFERANMPLPTIKETGGGVMAIIKRKTIDEIIAERDGESRNFPETNGGNTKNNGGNMAVIKLSNRQRLIVSLIVKQPSITAKQMAVMSGIPQRTIERELSILQKVDMICRVGAPRTGRWKLLKQIDFE